MEGLCAHTCELCQVAPHDPPVSLTQFPARPPRPFFPRVCASSTSRLSARDPALPSSPPPRSISHPTSKAEHVGAPGAPRAPAPGLAHSAARRWLRGVSALTGPHTPLQPGTPEPREARWPGDAHAARTRRGPSPPGFPVGLGLPPGVRPRQCPQSGSQPCAVSASRLARGHQVALLSLSSITLLRTRGLSGGASARCPRASGGFPPACRADRARRGLRAGSEHPGERAHTGAHPPRGQARTPAAHALTESKAAPHSDGRDGPVPSHHLPFDIRHKPRGLREHSKPARRPARPDAGRVPLTRQRGSGTWSAGTTGGGDLGSRHAGPAQCS